MAAKICADIKPSGYKKGDLVDLLYQVVSSIKGICAKLDDDTGVPSTTYEANVFTAIFNGVIEDQKGNSVRNFVAERNFFHITPTGITDAALLECIYQIFDMMETLTEQLDGDSLGYTNYEAKAYTAVFTYMVTNQNGNTLGNGNTYWFLPGAAFSPELVDLLYKMVNGIKILTTSDTALQGLDGDGTVTDTDYEALWYTATVLLTVENTSGNRIGN